MAFRRWIWLFINLCWIAFIAYKVFTINTDKAIIAALIGYPLFMIINLVAGLFHPIKRPLFMLAALHLLALRSVCAINSRW